MTHAMPHPNTHAARRRQSWLRAVIVLWRCWRARRDTRRDLRDLEAHRLADIGLSEADRRRECAKWFWQ